MLAPPAAEISNAGVRGRARIITIHGEIQSAKCYPAQSGRLMLDAVWGTLEDNRTLVYNAKSGRLLEEIADPCRGPAVQAELDAVSGNAMSPIRYAVVFTVSKKSNGFYDFTNGTWAWNHVPEGAMFKEREVAEAAAAALTENRRQCGKRSVIFPGKSRALQTVMLRKTAKGIRCLGEVTSRVGTYIPTLNRPSR